MFNRTALTILAAPLLAVAACSPPQHAPQAQRPHANHPGALYTIAASVFASPAPPAQTFTFQAVFSDPITADPIDGPAIIRVGLCDGPADTDPILTIVSFSPTYTNGRFTADVPLPATDTMLNITDPHICVLDGDGSDTPLIPRIPIQYAPFAWVAEHARTADALANESSTAPTIVGGANFGAGFDEVTATRQGSIVTLSGLMSRAVTIDNSLITLPEGFRPAGRQLSTGHTDIGAVRIDIKPNGEVSLGGQVTVTFVSFTGISFPAAP